MLYPYYTRYLILFGLIFLLGSGKVLAQFFDRFEDGNLSENPTWNGDLSDFTITAANELRLNAPAAGTSLLYTPIEKYDSIAWDFYFRMEFDPSGTNKLRIYLYNEGNDFTSGDALFLEMGENGNMDDIIVYERKNNLLKNLGKATGSNLAANPAEARIFVSYFSSSGMWQVFADYSKGNILLPVLTFQSDFTASVNLNFGLECIYTATRTSLFYFDDVGMNPLVEDTTPPVINNFTVTDDRNLNLGFNKIIREAILTNSANYSVNRGIGSPTSVEVLTPSAVRLRFNNTFNNGEYYELTVRNIRDTLGNILNDTILQFRYLTAELPEYGDIIISEIMADPSPPVNLPNAEYIEIYNRSEKILDLADLILARGTTTYSIPKHFILPGEYFMLCRIAEADMFTNVENKIGMTAFPAITNGGDELFLLNSNGDCVHHASFKLSDYGSSAKSDGGWSLELKYFDNPCYSTYWTASVNNNGGTPGVPNSVTPERAPATNIIKSFSIDDQAVSLHISHLLDVHDVTNIENWSFSPALNIYGIDYFPCSSSSDEVVIFTDDFEENTEYILTFRGIIKNCINESIEIDQSVFFVKPQLPQVGDLVINEILHHPSTGGSSYIEIYNLSDKFLKTSSLGLKNNTDQIIRISTDVLIPPASFITFTANRINTLSAYEVANPEWLVENNLPSLPNTSGTVVLLSFLPGEDVLRLDSLSYNANWHSDLLRNRAGIALERIEYSASSTSGNNWHSAAWNIGGGTPTAKNSQFRDPSMVSSGSVSLEPKVFSPDGDGYNDFTTILVNAEGSFNLTVRIFDLQGREVRTLINNQISGRTEKLIWDGTDNNGNKAVVGSYIVFIEGVDPAGSIIREKLSCVLAGNFN